MMCREMDEVIISGLRTRPLDVCAARHLAECEVCYRLIHILDEGARTPIVEELFGRCRRRAFFSLRAALSCSSLWPLVRCHSE